MQTYDAGTAIRVMNLIRQTFGNYQILSELGRGGMAVVYKARRLPDNLLIALKILPTYFAHDRELLARFRHEAENAARLDHPNIVRVLQSGEANGRHYIAIEFVEGESLKQLIAREGALALERSVKILAQLADALDYAHAQGIIHRDVKPANILIGQNDYAKLTDFGIAKAAEATQITRTGTLMGTPEYMSPEQARGEAVDARTDLYALAVVAYEMLSGRTPFRAETPHAVLHAQIYESPPLLKNVNSNLSPSLDSPFARALAKDPKQRFSDATSFVRALTEAQRVSEPPIFVSEPTQTPMVESEKSGFKMLVFLGALLAFLVLAVIIIGTVSQSRPPYTFVTPDNFLSDNALPTTQLRAHTVAPTFVPVSLHVTSTPRPSRIPPTRVSIAATRPPTRRPLPTRTITEIIYPAPKVYNGVGKPEARQSLFPAGVVMRWNLAQPLKEDEWFEIRAGRTPWVDRETRYPIAWTKENTFTFRVNRGSEPDWLRENQYCLFVRVVRGRDGQWLGNLSPDSNCLEFSS